MNIAEQSLRQLRTVRVLAKHLGLRIISLNQFFRQRMQHELLTPSGVSKHPSAYLLRYYQ